MLTSLLPQVGREDEILIVASGCTDKTVDVIRSFQDKRIQIIEEKKRNGKAAATNLVVNKARFSIIVYLDADVIIAPGAIHQLLTNFENNNIAAVSGRMIIQNPKSFFDHVCYFAREALHKQKLKENKEGKFWSINGYLFAIRKKLYQPIDKTNLVEDALLGWLLYQSGQRIVYEPNALVYEKGPQNLADYLNQKTRIRVGWWQMSKKYHMKISEKRNISHLYYLIKTPFAWVYLVLEIFVWCVALYRFHIKQYRWPVVYSSKI